MDLAYLPQNTISQNILRGRKTVAELPQPQILKLMWAVLSFKVIGPSTKVYAVMSWMITIVTWKQMSIKHKHALLTLNIETQFNE